MQSFLDIIVPYNFNYELWIQRWDSMQNKYLENRNERFELITDIIKATQSNINTIIELGCGAGSLMASIIESFPTIEIIGIDHDPTILLLANARLRQYGSQIKLLQYDIRLATWINELPKQVDVIVSATALHWLNAAQLSNLYNQIANKLKNGGLFINADHVSSESSLIQTYWDNNRTKHINKNINFDDWTVFWKEYSKALGIDVDGIHNNITDWYDPGIENGLPLLWHFKEMKKFGLSRVNCFWRKNGDAVYGGLK